MADLLQQASNWLEEKRTQHAAQTVRYVRGSQSVNLAATVGKTTFEVDDGYGVLVRHESRDFLVLSADLMLDGAPTLPERGDRVRETQAGQVFVYEVTAPGKEPCWRYSDAYRKTLRIHTSQVSMEAVS
jgi:hypothetical protein